MNYNRLIWAAVVVFVVMIILELIFHGGIMGSTYSALADQGIMRSQDEMGRYFWVELLMTALYAFFFVFIFAKGYEAKGFWEGVRYGIYITLFYSFVTSFEQFVTYGVPYGLTWLWILFGLIQNVIGGLLAAAIYRPKAAS